MINPFSKPDEDRQTNSVVENSIEAGILLGGNGVLHAIKARCLVERNGQINGFARATEIPISFVI
jgi:hypothetical protein